MDGSLQVTQEGYVGGAGECEKTWAAGEGEIMEGLLRGRGSSAIRHHGRLEYSRT